MGGAASPSCRRRLRRPVDLQRGLVDLGVRVGEVEGLDAVGRDEVVVHVIFLWVEWCVTDVGAQTRRDIGPSERMSPGREALARYRSRCFVTPLSPCVVRG